MHYVWNWKWNWSVCDHLACNDDFNGVNNGKCNTCNLLSVNSRMEFNVLSKQFCKWFQCFILIHSFICLIKKWIHNTVLCSRNNIVNCAWCVLCRAVLAHYLNWNIQFTKFIQKWDYCIWGSQHQYIYTIKALSNFSPFLWV